MVELIVIEEIAIFVGLMVIIMEAVILLRLRKHNLELNGFLKTQFELTKTHREKLDEHVQYLYEHSKKLEADMDHLLKETEDIYKRVCEGKK